MDVSIWDVLGIAETRNVREIKRAYATQLRITPPEDDPAGYMKLRDAYEAAKNYAKYAQDDEPGDDLPADRPEEIVRVEPAAAEVMARAAAEAEESVAQARLRRSPQQQAFEELDALLSEGKLDDFLVKIQAIQDAQTFSTLDEQNDFIGEVAQRVHDSDIDDEEWRGRLAELLGARERDNIFAEGTEHWYAYAELLHSYSEWKSAATVAHAQGQDEIGARPGYLHVFHVLTAPFDSERLMALTRSRTYHGLAEIILERSKTDPAIVIPQENRDWWERTAMAGQHRPAAEAVNQSSSSSSSSSSGFPGWIIWIVAMLILNGVRTCHDNSSSRITRPLPSQSTLYPSALPQVDVDTKQMRRVLLCDPQTRAALYRYRLKVSGQDDQTRLRYVWDENDPVVALLLAKCPQPP